MNQNEVFKHVIFQLLLYIGIGLCLLLSIIVILATPTKAAASNVNSYSHSTCSSSMGSTSRYGAFVGSSCNTNVIGTTYSGQAKTIGFWLNYNFVAGKYYTFTINFKDNDLLSSTIVDVVRVVNVSNSTEWSNTYSFVSKKQFKVYFMAPVSSSSVAISLSSGSGDPITGVSNFGISSITIDDNDNSDEIINNANQNTTDIMNNANQNSQDIQNSIFNNAYSIINELATRCNNLIDMSKFKTGILHNSNGSLVNTGNGSISNISSKTGSLTYTYSTAWNGVYYDYINVQDIDLYLNFSISTNGSTYLVKIDGFDENYNFVSHNGYSNSHSVHLCSNTNVSVCNSLNVKYIRFSIETNSTSGFTLSNLRVNTNNGPFCEYGSTANKLDAIGGVLGGIGDNINITNEKLDDTYDYITDDSNPSVPSNDLQNTFNSVQTSNPLSYLLTLPTTLLNAILDGLSSNSCTDFTIGRFGHVGVHDLGTYEFKFPCVNIEQKIGTNLWNTIDLFVSIGIVVWTIVRLYNLVSHYITLGASDEIPSHFLKPMDFLGNILGGNIGGVYGTMLGRDNP